MGRVTRVTDALGFSTDIQLNGVDQTTAVIDPLQQTTRIDHDPAQPLHLVSLVGLQPQSAKRPADRSPAYAQAGERPSISVKCRQSTKPAHVPVDALEERVDWVNTTLPRRVQYAIDKAAKVFGRNRLAFLAQAGLERAREVADRSVLARWISSAERQPLKRSRASEPMLPLGSRRLYRR